jgi:hypothetical protein
LTHTTIAAARSTAAGLTTAAGRTARSTAASDTSGSSSAASAVLTADANHPTATGTALPFVARRCTGGADSPTRTCSANPTAASRRGAGDSGVSSGARLHDVIATLVGATAACDGCGGYDEQRYLRPENDIHFEISYIPSSRYGSGITIKSPIMPSSACSKMWQ